MWYTTLCCCCAHVHILSLVQFSFSTLSMERCTQYCELEEVRNDHVLRLKCCVITFIPTIKLYIVNFDGDFEGNPLEFPSKTGMTVISNQNYNVWARDPLGIPQFFSFNTATVWGHTHNDAHWYAQKSHGMLIILYLFWLWAYIIKQQKLAVASKFIDSPVLNLFVIMLAKAYILLVTIITIAWVVHVHHFEVHTTFNRRPIY